MIKFALVTGIAVALGVIFVVQDAVAQSTCSGIRNACLKGTQGRSSRGIGSTVCHSAYDQCMKTGIWDTTGYGSYGVKRTGLAKR